jgi:hypothetical protein
LVPSDRGLNPCPMPGTHPGIESKQTLDRLRWYQVAVRPAGFDHPNAIQIRHEKTHSDNLSFLVEDGPGQALNLDYGVHQILRRFFFVRANDARGKLAAAGGYLQSGGAILASHRTDDSLDLDPTAVLFAGQEMRHGDRPGNG